jgi:Flp pilus assembly pilin Flp
MLQLMCTLEVLGFRATEALQRRMKNDRGQTAAEYLGIIVVIAVIVGILAQTKIGDTLQKNIVSMIDKVMSGNGK